MVRRDAENAEAQRLSPQFLTTQNSNGSGVFLSAHSPVTPISEDFSHLTPGDEVFVRLTLTLKRGTDLNVQTREGELFEGISVWLAMSKYMNEYSTVRALYSSGELTSSMRAV